MDSDRGKTRDAMPGGQVGEGRLNQVSEFIGEETGDTSNWVEIYRTDNEWEVKLILATLNAQQIRCRPVQIKKGATNRPIRLSRASGDSFGTGESN